ncbi:hypothetical protein K469DRAFT_756528 [Zopfia rhizophila CBS 207.26]|uniref:Uncharacterized protein n=1 Tax=Zopfia rhizophila CBS 207.26 TaxID=1314779 RepID=A0A6A6DAE9_9PEZI|nr:hypothetical protein K469DRAFT_756528 [Zopfia rhizophila CBS 207.26]
MNSWGTDNVSRDSDHFNFEGNDVGGSAFDLLLATEEPETFGLRGDANIYQSSAHETYSDSKKNVPLGESYSRISSTTPNVAMGRSGRRALSSTEYTGRWDTVRQVQGNRAMAHAFSEDSSLGGQIAGDVRDYRSQLLGEGNVFPTDLRHDQYLTEDVSIGGEGSLEQQYSGLFTPPYMDGRGNSTMTPQHYSPFDFGTANNVQSAQTSTGHGSEVVLQQDNSDFMMLEQHHPAVPVAAVESEVEWVSAIQYVGTNLHENWLADRRKYPVINGRFYCPQCFYDSIYTSQTLGELVKSSPKSYRRSQELRRHWRDKHSKTGYLQIYATGY